MKFNTSLIILLPLLASIPNTHASQDAIEIADSAISFIQNDPDKAENLIEKGLHLAPNEAEVNFACGRIMGRQAENTFFSAYSYAKKSLRCLKKAVELAPNEYRYRVGLLNFYLGAPSIAGGDKDLAWQQVEMISQLDALQGAKAELKYLQSTEQNSKLANRLAKLHKLYPKDAEINFRYGLLMQEQQNYQQAFSAFKSASASSDRSSYYYNSLYQLGRNAVFSELNAQDGIEGLLLFVEQFDDAINVPPIEWAYFRLAQLYDVMQNEAQRKHYYSLARQSDDRDLHRALKNILSKEK